MLKIMISTIGFALTTALAMPALAEMTPSNEGYAGGYVAQETAFQTAETSPNFDVVEAGVASRNAANPSIEGYSGNADINQAAVLSTQKIREQYASDPGVDNAAVAVGNARDEFAEMEQRVRYRGR